MAYKFENCQNTKDGPFPRDSGVKPEGGIVRSARVAEGGVSSGCKMEVHTNEPRAEVSTKQESQECDHLQAEDNVFTASEIKEEESDMVSTAEQNGEADHQLELEDGDEGRVKTEGSIDAQSQDSDHAEDKFSDSHLFDGVPDLHLHLRCPWTTSIVSDFARTGVQKVYKIQARFEHYGSKKVHIDDLFARLQYMLASLFLNLEFKYPFVCSSYARRFAIINYRQLVEVNHILAGETDADTLHRLLIKKLTAAALAEFNLLNIMKECDQSLSRRATLRRNKLNFNTTNEASENSQEPAAALKTLDAYALKSLPIDVRPLRAAPE